MIVYIFSKGNDKNFYVYKNILMLAIAFYLLNSTISCIKMMFENTNVHRLQAQCTW